MDRKKAVTIDEDEYSFPDDPDQNPQSATAAVKVNRVSAAPKKGKKGGAKVKKKNDDDDVAAVVVAADPEDDEESVNLVSSGKKKSSKSKKSCSAFSPFYSLYSLEEEDVVVDDDRSEVVVNNHVDEERDEEAEAEAEDKAEVPAKRKAVDNKKLPKHVRAMREAHAFRKMWEERRKRLEEERLRKEEEEEERLAELRRWRKKRMEKVKLLKMKRNSRLFMDEQLAEYMMLAAIRRKISGQNEVPAGDAPVEVKERPKYESEKSKQKVLEAEKPRENTQAVVEPEVEQAEEDVMNEESQSQASGVEDKVEAQQDQIGTPICIPLREFIDIGKIASIEINHKQIEVATKGQKVAIKIVGSNPE